MSESSTFNRFRVSDTNGDYFRRREQYQKRNDHWYITNILPNDLEIYVQRYATPHTEIEFLSKIRHDETLKFEASEFVRNDILHFMTRNNQGELESFVPEYTMVPWQKDITIGNVTHTSGGGHSEYQTLWTDMKGIQINNLLRFPLEIIYRGNVVAIVGAYDGLTYLGGSAASVNFTYSRNGINFEDEITFRYPRNINSPYAGRTLYTIRIDDIQSAEMFVGSVVGKFIGPDPDNAVYRTPLPSYTGITYYENIGGYETAETNPNAPF